MRTNEVMEKNNYIQGPEIKICGQIGRFEIVKKVVTMFIEYEKG